ncbi:phage minor head protein [Xanthomonas campestris]|uniref:phage minor head protein n=1 Tax=Xanthomonas campestris TaxID=339 RepID=UPI000E32C940|nr:phage minor head protein [Xanthomonas campestris]RFF46179.1 head morphogenesis protein [Xanthomonas campestris]
MAATTSRQLEQLAAKLEPAIARAFLKAVAEITNQAGVQLIADLLQAGRIDDVLTAMGMDEPRFADLGEALRNAYAAGGQQGVSEMPRMRLNLDPIITGSYKPRQDVRSPALRPTFDLRNATAEAWLRENSSRLIAGIVNDQRTLIRNVLESGMVAGRNPRQSALDIVGRVGETGRRTGGVVGLTAQQGQFVQSMRGELTSDDPREMAKYFGRKRRDKRLDGIVRRAIAAGKPVSQTDIDKIVGRYADRLLQLRGEMIARTESITSMNAGREEAYRQQVASGALAPENVTGTWSDSGDQRTRHTHKAMNGQKRAFGEPFESPSGARLNYPGDTSLGAGPEEIVGCRCTKQYRIDMTAEVLRGKQVR